MTSFQRDTLLSGWPSFPRSLCPRKRVAGIHFGQRIPKLEFAPSSLAPANGARFLRVMYRQCAVSAPPPLAPANPAGRSTYPAASRPKTGMHDSGRFPSARLDRASRKAFGKPYATHDSARPGPRTPRPGNAASSAPPFPGPVAHAGQLTYSMTSRPKPEMPCRRFGALSTRILRTPRSARICAPSPKVRRSVLPASCSGGVSPSSSRR